MYSDAHIYICYTYDVYTKYQCLSTFHVPPLNISKSTYVDVLRITKFHPAFTKYLEVSPHSFGDSLPPEKRGCKILYYPVPLKRTGRIAPEIRQISPKKKNIEKSNFSHFQLQPFVSFREDAPPWTSQPNLPHSSPRHLWLPQLWNSTTSDS